ncbi:unnamed protein product [Gongylonema pulchrum]|uniref:Peptidase S41 n=1 Tax=Gongylonema pulchrum TaxID=637853 RepID=A0A183EK96_9BILA|nr:unnamed protein product [Gongylonema pulchrum]
MAFWHVFQKVSESLYHSGKMQSSLLCIWLLYLNANAQNDNAASNDYAEVRTLLDQYYQITAKKYGSFHDYDPKKVSRMLKDIPAEDETEAGINRRQGIVGDLFENDILLTLPQAKALLKETSRSS